MPTYSISAPDGNTYSIEGPEGASQQDVIQKVLAQHPEANTPVKPRKGVLADVMGGAENLLNIGKTGIAALTGNTNAAAQAGIEREKNLQQKYESGFQPEKILSEYDKGNYLSAAGEALKQVPSAVAGLIPSIGQEAGLAAAGRLGGGALGSIFGPAGTAAGATAGQYAVPLIVNAIQALGSQAQEKAKAQVENGEKVDVDVAELAPYAGANAALNLVGTRIAIPSVFKKAIGQKVAAEAENEARLALMKEAEKVAGRGTLKTVARGALGFTVGELPTEVLQDVVDRAAIGKPLADDDALQQYRVTALNMALGAPLGGAIGLHERSGAREQVSLQSQRDQQAKAAADAQARAQADAAEQVRRQTPEYAKEAEQTYNTAEKVKADLQAQIQKSTKTQPLTEAQKQDNAAINAQLRDHAPILKAAASEYRRVRSVLDATKEQERVAAMTPEDYMLEQMQGRAGQGIQVSGRRGAERSLYQTEAAPAPKADTTLTDYAAQQIGAARSAGDMDLGSYADYLMQDPKLAQQLVENRVKIPPIQEGNAAFALSTVDNNNLLSGLKLRLAEQEKQAKKATAQELATRQADLQTQQQVAPVDERMSGFMEGADALEDLRPKGFKEQQPRSGPDLSIYTDHLFEKGLTSEQPVVKVNEAILPSDKAVNDISKLHSLLNEADRADQEHDTAKRANEQAAASAALGRGNLAVKQINALAENGPVHVQETIAARRAQQDALARLEDEINKIRANEFLGKEKGEMAGGTLETALARAERARAEYISSALQEAAIARRVQGRPALTIDEATKAALQLHNGINEWINRVQALPWHEALTEVVEQRAQMRGTKLVKGAETRMRDVRPLEERRFGAYHPAVAVIKEQLDTLRNQLANPPRTPQRVETGPLKRQFAAEEATKTAEARGETATTLAGELRRRTEFVRNKMSKMGAMRPAARDALNAAADVMDAGSATRELLDTIEPVVDAIVAGRQVSQRDVRSIKEALAATKPTAEEQREAGQQSLFPETREDIGHIRATASNFEKSPAVKAGRAALGIAKKLAIANRKIIDAATERLNKRIPEAQKNYAIAVKEAFAEAKKEAMDARAALYAPDIKNAQNALTTAEKQLAAVQTRIGQMIAAAEAIEGRAGEQKALAKELEKANALQAEITAAQQGLAELSAKLNEAYNGAEFSAQAMLDGLVLVERKKLELLDGQLKDLQEFQKSNPDIKQKQAEAKAQRAVVGAAEIAAKRNAEAVNKQKNQMQVAVTARQTGTIQTAKGETLPGLRVSEPVGKQKALALAMRGAMQRLEETKTKREELAKQNKPTKRVDNAIKKLEGEIAGYEAQSVRPGPVVELIEKTTPESRAAASRAQSATALFDQMQRAQEKQEAVEKMGQLKAQFDVLRAEGQALQEQGKSVARINKQLQTLKAQYTYYKNLAGLVKTAPTAGPVARTQTAAPSTMRTGTTESIEGAGSTASQQQKLSQARKPRKLSPAQEAREVLENNVISAEAALKQATKEALAASEKLNAAKEGKAKEEAQAVVDRAETNENAKANALELAKQALLTPAEKKAQAKLQAATQAELDKGAMLSRGTPTKALSVKEVEAELAKAMGEPVTGRPREAQVSRVLGVYQTVEDALAAVGSDIDIPADAKGFVLDGRAFLIADNIGKGEALGVLLHEVGVHIGFRNFFNAGQFKALVGTVRSWANRNDGSLESKVGKAAIARAEAAETSAANMDDEILAYAVEEAVKAGVSPAGVTKRSAIHNWLKMLVDAFKNALKTLGFNPTNLTTGDLVNFAYGCAQLELKGTWHGTAATFEQFDHAYMGTGEGNQAYGYGTYRAQSPGVAKYYRDMTASRPSKKIEAWWKLPEIKKWNASTIDDPIYKGKTFAEIIKAHKKQNFEFTVAGQIVENYPTPAPYFSTEADHRDWWASTLQTYISGVEYRLANKDALPKMPAKYWADQEKLLAAAKKMDAADFDYVGNLPPIPFPVDKGNLLRVVHGAKEDAYLQLDASYSAQSRQVSDGLKAAFKAMTTAQKAEFNRQVGNISDPDGKFLYDAFKIALGSQKAASELLAANGIVGNKFFDAPTRKAGLRGEAADFNYVDFLDKDQGPQVLGENLTPIGRASGPLFSRAAKYGEDNALSQLAQDTVARKKGWWQSMLGGSNHGLEFEMQTTDMRAALRKVMEAGAKSFGDSRLFQQAMYSYTKADQKMPLTLASLSDGPLELYEDAKGLKGIRTTGKDSAREVFDAVGGIPDKYGNEAAKMEMATMYMIAQRATNKGLAKLDLGALGITQDRVDAAMAAANADPQLKGALEKVRERYNAYNKGQIEFLAETGSITKAEAREFLREGDYVPYYRIRENGIAELVFGGEKTLTIGDIRHQPQLAALKGGEAKILPINESIPRNTALLINKAMTNLATRNVAYALQELGKAADTMQVRKGYGATADASIIRFNQEPDPNDPKDTGERHVRVQTNGTVAEGIPAEMLVRSLEGAPLTLPAFLKWGGVAGDLLRAGVTRTPLYLMRQLFRDPMAATAAAGLDYSMLTAVYKANKEFLKMSTGQSATAAELIKKGLIQSGIFTGDTDDIAKFATQLASGKDFNVFEKFFRMADKAAMDADAATRALVYDNAINKGLSEVEADFATMESMNFHKRGLSPTVQYVSRMIPFFNSQIQGLNVLYKAATGQMPFNEQLKIKQKFYNNAMLLAASGIAYAMAMQDDDYYKNAKPKDRYSNFMVHLPGVDEPLKLPIPYEFGWFFSMGAAAADAMAGQTDGAQQARALRDMFVGAIPGSSSMGVPQVIKPFAEVWTNKDFNTGNELESKRLQGKSVEERYNANTTELAKAMSKFAPILSPIQIERIVSGYFGQIPLAVLAATNGLFNNGEVEPVPKNLSEMSFIGSAFQKKYGGADADVMYKLADEAMQYKRDFDAMKREGRVADAKDFVETHRTELRVAPMALQYQKLMGNIRATEERIRGANMPGDEKRKRIDELEKRKQDLAEKFEQRIKQLES